MAIKSKYFRIQGRELAANTKTGKGIFSILNQMVTNGTMDEEDVQKGWGPAVDPA